MSAYVKFVCDYCGESEIEFEYAGSIESTLHLLWDYGWDASEGDMCGLCMWNNV